MFHDCKYYENIVYEQIRIYLFSCLFVYEIISIIPENQLLTVLKYWYSERKSGIISDSASCILYLYLFNWQFFSNFIKSR